MEREIIPFVRNIPHFYPAKNLSRKDYTVLEADKQHEGERFGLPDKFTTTLFSSIERAVMQSDEVMDAVEKGRFVIPENLDDTEIEYFKKISSYVSSKNKKERSELWDEILSQTYREKIDDTELEWDRLRDVMVKVSGDTENRDSELESLSQMLHEEFDPPSNFAGVIIFERHSTRDIGFDETVDYFFNEGIKIFKPNSRNILYIENSRSPYSEETINRINEKCRRIFDTHLDTLIAGGFWVNNGRMPNKQEYKRYKEDELERLRGDFGIAQFAAADKLVASGLPVDIILERNRGVKPFDQKEEVKKVKTFIQYRKFLERFGKFVRDRDIGILEQIIEISRVSDVPTEFLGHLGTFHGTNFRELVPHGLLQVMDIRQFKKPFYITPTTSKIFNDLIREGEIDEEDWRIGFEEFYAERIG